MNEFVGELTLDLDCRKTMPKISVGQYDKGRKYLIHITSGGTAFSAKDSTVILQGIRHDKSHFSAVCSLDDEDNVILVLSDDILCVSGFTYAKLVLSDTDKNYSTQIFIIDVDGSYEGDITAADSYSIVNDFMNKLMLLFGLNSPGEMLKAYLSIKDITEAEVDEAVDRDTLYDVYSETTGYRRCLYRIMCIVDRDIRTQYRFSGTANLAKRVIEARMQARNVVTGTWLAWSDWTLITGDSQSAGITIIDDATAAEWDGYIPTTYAGERGDLVYMNGFLWYLCGISELNGTKYYSWTRLIDEQDFYTNIDNLCTEQKVRDLIDSKLSDIERLLAQV